MSPSKHQCHVTVLLAVLIVVSASQVSPAKAQPAKSAEQKAAELNLKGADAYEQGKVQIAQLFFKEAVRLDPLPKFILNFALAADKVGDCPAALAAFERYILETKSDPSSSETHRKAADERVARLRPQCAAATDLFENEDLVENGTTDAALETKSPDIAPVDPYIDSTRKSYWLPLAIGSGVVAVAFGGYGIFKARKVSSWASKANSEASDEDFPFFNVDPCTVDPLKLERYATLKRYCEKGRSAATQATVSFVAAGAFGVAAGVFGYLAWRSSSEGEPRATVMPTIGVLGDVGVLGLVRF